MGSPKLRDVRVNFARARRAMAGGQVLDGANVRPLVKTDEDAAVHQAGYVRVGEALEAMLAASPRRDDGKVTDEALQRAWANLKLAGDDDPEGFGVYLPSSTGLRHQRTVGLASERAIVPDGAAAVGGSDF